MVADFVKRFRGSPPVRAGAAIPDEPGAVTVLFGPSGAGKTTVLRCLAGLDRPDEGRIEFRGEAWFRSEPAAYVPAQARRIGFVPQEDALFPHLDAAGNVAFGISRWREAERDARVGELLRALRVPGLAQRRPHELSQGQRQRVSLARALAPRPRLLLLDEPFASLDEPTRVPLRSELRRVLREDGVPAVVVTHDRDEALALGDRMLVMVGGAVRQSGAVEDVLRAPADADVARAVGTENVVPARVAAVRSGLATLECAGAFFSAPAQADGDVYALFRADTVTLEKKASASSARNRLPATVRAIEPAGALSRVLLDAAFPIVALVTRASLEEMKIREGSRVVAVVKASSVRLVPRPGRS